MASVHHDHMLKVTDLIDRPGASRQVRLAVPPPEDLELPLVVVREPLELDGVIESVVDGLLVRGALHADLALECARCLAPTGERARADVVELFVDPARVPPDAEPPEPGYEITDGHIDLDALLRDSLAPAAPRKPLCRPDCAGLCAECGANLNEGACSCADDDVDPRWAALGELDLPEDTDRP